MLASKAGCRIRSATGSGSGVAWEPDGTRGDKGLNVDVDDAQLEEHATAVGL